MKIILLTIYFTLVVCQSTIMITFDQPGNFILTPEMYYYADNFIIEMWGGGAAGGCSCCEDPYHSTHGGGSGSYIKAYINTYQNNFNITIGHGGFFNASCYNHNGDKSYLFALNGGNTSIINQNINLMTGGGYINTYFSGSNDLGGKIFSLILHNSNDIIYMNNQGYSGCNFYTTGGSAPYGGSGGGNIVNGVNIWNGLFPGAGGAYIGNDDCNRYYCDSLIIPYGANGGIILYLSK